MGLLNRKRCPQCENICESYIDPNKGDEYCSYCGYNYTTEEPQEVWD